MAEGVGTTVSPNVRRETSSRRPPTDEGRCRAAKREAAVNGVRAEARRGPEPMEERGVDDMVKRIIITDQSVERHERKRVN